jgi:phosphocarrier protein
MVEIKYLIKDELGLHARPAGKLVKLAAKYKCDIQIGNQVKKVNAKRIMGVMALILKHNQEMTISFDGEDEVAASEAMKAFLEDDSNWAK